MIDDALRDIFPNKAPKPRPKLVPCPACGGTGDAPDDSECATCDGNGHVPAAPVGLPKPALANALEFAWTIICNAGEGDWTRESADWQKAASKFRDEYHALLDDGALKHD